MSKIKNFLIGILIGIVNSFFGSGGGMLVVPLLKNQDFEQKDAHRNAIAVILPISLISAIIYIYRGSVKISDAFPYMITGLLGAFLGTKILEKISPKILKAVFSGFMIYAGVRLLFK